MADMMTGGIVSNTPADFFNSRQSAIKNSSCELKTARYAGRGEAESADKIAALVPCSAAPAAAEGVKAVA
jgi:hypothetical protein